jgi:hypothetical protein
MNTEKTKCADCDEECELHEYADNNGDSVCSDCSEDYCWDEIDECTIRADDSVYAINGSGRYDCVTTHSDNAEYIDGEYYTEDGVSENFSDCTACGERLCTHEAYHTEYDGPFCECCLPQTNCEEYDSGYDVDADDSSFEEMTSRRTFGIELEYADASDCASRNENNGSYYFECKEDGSLRGECCAEFASPILCGDLGLEAIRDFADCAEYTDPNNTCGFHCHVGLDDLTDNQKARLARLLSKVEKVARMFVPPSRSNNDYCSNWLNCADADENVGFYEVRNSHRYSAFNFSGKGTLEIRLHHSTKCADEMVKWVKLWCAVVDYVADCDKLSGWDGLTDQAIFNKLTALAGREIAEFYADRAEKYGYSDSIKKEDISLRNDCKGQLLMQFA